MLLVAWCVVVGGDGGRVQRGDLIRSMIMIRLGSANHRNSMASARCLGQETNSDFAAIQLVVCFSSVLELISRGTAKRIKKETSRPSQRDYTSKGSTKTGVKGEGGVFDPPSFARKQKGRGGRGRADDSERERCGGFTPTSWPWQRRPARTYWREASVSPARQRTK